MSGFNSEKYNSIIPYTRYCELKKVHGLTQEQIARHVGISLPAVKKWASKQTIPEHHFGKLAELFDVDVAYLIGEQNFEKLNEHLEKIKKQSPLEFTGLSAESFNLLMNDKWIKILNILFSNPYFEELLSELNVYDDSILDYQILTLDLPDQNCISEYDYREIHKNKVISIFSKLLDNLYEHTSTAGSIKRFSDMLYQILIQTKEIPPAN